MYTCSTRITDKGIFVEVTDLRNGTEELKKELFQKPENAETFIRLKLQRYIAFRLSRYVKHSAQIALNSKSAYYHTEEFEKSMKVCSYLIRIIDTKSYYELSRMIRDNYSHLWTIRPHMDNNSHNRSVATIIELKQLADRFKQNN